MQPKRLPYPVRIEEIITIDRDGAETVKDRTEMVADQLLVRVLPDKEAALLELARHSSLRAEKLSRIGIYRIHLPEAKADTVPQALEHLQQMNDLLAYAEPDAIVRPTATPDDPGYLDGSLWGMHNTGQNEGVADADIDAPEGWDIRTDASDIIVGVIDTGIRYTHEDIAANMWVNPGEDGLDAFGNSKRTNGIDDDNNGYIDDVHGLNAIEKNGNPMDTHGHGSHVAGTIAGVGNNGIGVAGVAWTAKVMALRFIDKAGATSDAILCFEYAMEKGVRLTNNSWGGSSFSQSLFDIIAAANDAGMLVVAAAGNDEANTDSFNQYPANYFLPNILSVAAINRKDELAVFSNYGTGSVEIAAPGQAIYSLGIDADDDYKIYSGTSMATPMVVGVAAMVASAFPESDVTGLKNRLLNSVRPVAALTGKVSSGGVVNLHDALLSTSEAPFNDAFERAIEVSEDPGIFRGNTFHASAESGEPPHAGSGGNSVWYKWTAQVPGTTIANTYGSDFDTVVAVYTGASPDALSLVAENDDFEGQITSRVEWESTEGADYYIAVAGKNNAEGSVHIIMSGPPEEDFFADALEIPYFPFYYTSDNTNASREEGEPVHAGAAGGGSLWLRLKLADSSRKIVLNTRNSEYDTLLAVYQSDLPSPAFEDLQLVVESDDGPYGEAFSEVRFTAEQNRTYWVVTDGKDGERGLVYLRGFTQAANDDFSDPIPLTGNSVETAVSIRDLRAATRESGEPNHANAGGESSLWWTWTPDVPGDFLVRLEGSPAFGLYTGNSLESLLSVAVQRRTDGAASTAKILNAQPGTVYRVAVDALRDAFIPGNPILSIAPFVSVANDNWAQAVELTGMPGTDSPLVAEGTNLNATIQGGEPGNNLANTVWYVWTAPESGEFAADTHFSECPARLNIYETNGSPAWFNEFTPVGSGDQNGVDDDAWVRFTAVAGKTYYFQIGSPSDSSAGAFQFHLKPFQRLPNDDFANAEELTGFFIQRELENFGTTRESGEPLHATDNTLHNNYEMTTEVSVAQKTLWFKWTADAATARRTSASAFGSNTTTVVAVYEGPAEGATFGDLVPLAGASSHWYSWWAWGEFNWDAEAGKTYYIMLGTGQDTKEEILRFSFWQNPNDDFADRVVLSGDNVSITTANFAATFEPGEPVHIPDTPGGRSLWYEWTAPETGTYILDTIHSFLKDRFVAMGMNPDMNNTGGRMQMAVYRGSTLGSLFRVASNSGISMRDYDAMISLNATAGTTYHIALDSKVGPASAVEGPKTEWCYRSVIHFNISKDTLPNDNLADAKEISGNYHQEFVDLKYASRESGEPTHGGRASRSAWWKWTAPDSGVYHVATASDLFDTQDSRTPGIAVYSSLTGEPGFDLFNKEAEANNNEYSASYIPAQASFYALAGQFYYIAVDLDSTGTGSHKGFKTGLLLSKTPQNDNFANAAEISGSRRTVHGHNVGATEEPGEPDIDPTWKKAGATNSSVWWKWTAPASGLTAVDTKGSFIYAELGVYTGSAIGQLLEIVKEDTQGSFDNGFSYAERADLADREVAFNAQAGTTYFFLVNGSSWEKESRGPITLTVTGQPGPPLRPTDLRGVRLNAGRVQLSWTDEAVDEANYVIQRSASSDGPWQEVYASGMPDVTSWTDLNASGPFFYRVRAEGPGGIGDWATVFVGSAKNMTAIETWREQHFGTADNAGDAADSADPDGDALANKLEFALMGNPLLPDARDVSPVQTVIDSDGDLYLQYSYRRRLGEGSGSTLTGYTVDGITYSLETAPSIGTQDWLSGPEFLEEPAPPVNNGDGTEIVTVRVRQPVTSEGPFVRLLID
ncbi:MAG: S8 family serine peptidase [Oceanipulchritudo sp.]